MRMLGTDVHTQAEFDQFKAEEFDPVKVEAAAATDKVAKLQAKVQRLEQLCLAFAVVSAIAILFSYIL
jgi:BMFP domain-containing protein YqiC